LIASIPLFAMSCALLEKGFKKGVAIDSIDFPAERMSVLPNILARELLSIGELKPGLNIEMREPIFMLLSELADWLWPIKSVMEPRIFSSDELEELELDALEWDFIVIYPRF
jgi:hypothetical protein